MHAEQRKMAHIWQRHAVNALEDDSGRDTPCLRCDDILDRAWKSRSRWSDLAEICRSCYAMHCRSNHERVIRLTAAALCSEMVVFLEDGVSQRSRTGQGVWCAAYLS